MKWNKASFMKFESVKYPESHLVEWPLERRHCLNSRTKVANKDRQQKQIFSWLPTNKQLYKYTYVQTYNLSQEQIFKQKWQKFAKKSGKKIRTKVIKIFKQKWQIKIVSKSKYSPVGLFTEVEIASPALNLAR